MRHLRQHAGRRGSRVAGAFATGCGPHTPRVCVVVRLRIRHGHGVILDDCKSCRPLAEMLVVYAEIPAAYRRIRPTAVSPTIESCRALGVWRNWLGPRARLEPVRHTERSCCASGAQLVAVTMDVAGAVVFEPGPCIQLLQPRPPSVPRRGRYLRVSDLALAGGLDTRAATDVASPPLRSSLGRTDADLLWRELRVRPIVHGEVREAISLPTVSSRAATGARSFHDAASTRHRGHLLPQRGESWATSRSRLTPTNVFDG